MSVFTMILPHVVEYLYVAFTMDCERISTYSPLMMVHGEEDGLLPLDGVRKIGQRTKESYKAQGVGGRFQLLTFPGGHSFPDEVVEVAYGWLDCWLKDEGQS